MPDQHSVELNLEITDASKAVYTSTISFTVNAPELSVGNLIIDDAATGNNDGRLDPGETANITIETSNNGHADVSNVIGAISSTSTDLVINSATTTPTGLTVGQTSSFTFNVTADAATSAGTLANIDYTATAGVDNQYSVNETKEIVIGFVPEYCGAGSDIDTDEFIERVQFVDIDNTTTLGGGYNDYTNISTDVVIDEDYSITITNGHHYSGDQMGCWIDWNYDGDFEDANETVTINYSNPNGTATISIPADAHIGHVTMRLRVAYTSGNDPCGNASYGEVEDYTLNVLPSSTPSGVLSANNTNICVESNSGTLTLTDNTSTITSWEKRVDAGAWSTIANTSNTYSETISTAGTWDYRVVLDDGTYYSNEIQIVVHDNPVANFTYVANEGTATFTNTSSNASTYDWNFGDGGTSTLMNPEHTYTGSGTYTVWLSAYSPYCPSSSINGNVVVVISGIYDVNGNKISIYPNPNSGTFSINLMSLKGEDVKVEITSITGRTVYFEETSKEMLNVDLHNQAQGIYFVKVSSGGVNFTGKIMIK